MIKSFGMITMMLFFLLACNLPVTWAVPTTEAIGIEWQSYERQDDIKGFYIYWASRDKSKECRLHTTYHDGARFQLEDPTATKADFIVFLPKGLKELCFAVTVYEEEDRESGYATRDPDNDDFGWTGLIIPKGVFTK